MAGIFFRGEPFWFKNGKNVKFLTSLLWIMGELAGEGLGDPKRSWGSVEILGILGYLGESWGPVLPVLLVLSVKFVYSLGIGATIRTLRESRCFPYAVYFFILIV